MLIRNALVYAGAFVLSLILGCDNLERIAQLQKQNRELTAKLESVSNAMSLGLQEKCSKQAREQFKLDGWDKEKSNQFYQS